MGVVTENLDLWWGGFLRSLGIALWGLVGSLVWGTVLAIFRISPVPVLRGFGTFYVTWLRNTPLAIVLFTMAFGIPDAGVQLLLLRLRRGGTRPLHLGLRLRGRPLGHRDGADGSGGGGALHRAVVLAEPGAVILPQALRAVVPPVGNVLIAMIKNSAVVGALGVGRDLFSVYNRLTSAQGYAGAADDHGHGGRLPRS